MEHWIMEGNSKRAAEKHVCMRCEKEFLRRLVVFSGKKKQEFCSRVCRFATTDRIQIPCSKCEKVFLRAPSKIKTRNFCSRKCQAEASVKRSILCLNCNGKTANEKCSKYCSRRCQTEYLYTQYIKSWLDGKESGLSGEGTSTRIRKYLLNECENKCSKCGWDKVNQTTGKKPLEINHIDGKYQNNSLQNLEILCPSCHSLTPNYGSLNKGNGRPKRKEKCRLGL